MREIIAIISCCFLTVCGQICLKIGLSQSGGFWQTQLSPLKNIENWLSSPMILLGLAIYVGATVIFMYLLDRFELTYFYPWTAIMYVFAFLAGILIFQEPVIIHRMIGTLIVITGVIVIASGG